MNTEQERTYSNMRRAVMDVITDVHDRAAQIDEAVDEVIDLVRAALQSQPQKTIAYLTRNEECDPAMLFFDLKEARLYCNPDEEPEALALAGSALQSQDAEDAARYRWLRQQHWNDSELCVVANPKKAVHPGYDCPSLDRLDEAIDHARRIEEN